MERTQQMYGDIQIHNFIEKILSSFYLLKLWNASDGETTSYGLSNTLKWLQLLYFASFVLSMAGGAYLSTDTDEIIFLTVAAMINGVIVCRMAIIIAKKNEIAAFVQELGTHTINNANDFTRIDGDVERFIKFAKAFVMMCVAGVTFALFAPVLSGGKRLVFNIALPTQWKDNAFVFWMAHFYSVLGCVYSSHALMLNVLIWYLMLSCSLKYQVLGNRLKKFGVQHSITRRKKRNLFLREMILTTATHLRINE